MEKLFVRCFIHWKLIYKISPKYFYEDSYTVARLFNTAILLMAIENKCLKYELAKYLKRLL